MRLLRTLIWLCVAQIFLLFSGNSFVFAQTSCGCYSYGDDDSTTQIQVKNAVRESKAVFSGRVVNITTISSGIYQGMLEITFEVDEVWKNVKTKLIKVVTNPTVISDTPPFSVNCGFPFELGELYLVFIERKLNNTFQTGRCSRTKKQSEATNDLRILGKSKLKYDS